MTPTADVRLTADLACPSCHTPHALTFQLTADTSRRAVRRPLTPEIIHVCPSCHDVVILALCAVREGAAA